MSIRKLKNGRWQADVSDRRRGVARTKRSFWTRKEAQEWLAAVRTQAHDRLLGRRERHVFGQALAQYLREESPKKLSHGDDLINAAALRWPVRDGRGWLLLEDAPLDDSDRGVIAVLAKWVADMRGIVKRGYIGHQTYHLRKDETGSLAWYLQPDPSEGDRPRPRSRVTDAALLRHLDKSPGRGPFSTGTLRIRQLLVSRVLRVAWRTWRWIDEDLAAYIDLQEKAPERDDWLPYEQLRDLVIHAPIGLDEAILAGAWIGWRWANLFGRERKRPDGETRTIEGLTWDRVVFPVYAEEDGRREVLQHGYYWAPRNETKTKKPLAQPMSDRVEQLLRLRWEQRSGRLVFHRGDGKAWGDVRKLWRRTKRAAGIPDGFRWHDLRHTWASHLLQAGATDRELGELGGWTDVHMPRRYSHMRLDHLVDAVNRPGKGGKRS